MDAKAWFYSQSFEGGRYDCEKPKAETPISPTIHLVDQWDGEKWVTRTFEIPRKDDGEAA